MREKPSNITVHVIDSPEPIDHEQKERSQDTTAAIRAYVETRLAREDDGSDFLGSILLNALIEATTDKTASTLLRLAVDHEQHQAQSAFARLTRGEIDLLELLEEAEQ